MLFEAGPLGTPSDETISQATETVGKGTLILQPMELRNPDRAEEIGHESSGLARTYRAQCELRPALEAHGLHLVESFQLIEGSRFVMTLSPQRDLFRRCTLEDAIGDLGEQLIKACSRIRAGDPDRHQIPEEHKRLLAYLVETRQRLILPGLSTQSISPPPIERHLSISAHASGHTVSGVIVSIDTANHRVMLNGQRIIAGVQTDGLEVGQWFSLQCHCIGTTKVLNFRPVDSASSSQLSLSLAG